MMINVNVNTGQPIYDLIAILEDAKKGYLNAAEKIRDNVLSLLLEKYGYERGRYIIELKQLVKRFDIISPIDEFTLSLLHRTWMDMKTTFKLGQKQAIILACIKGEENAIKNYGNAIKQILNNEEIKLVLEKQANAIKNGLNSIKEYISNTPK